MFLNKTVFKKWIKEAYNHGALRVGRIFDGFVLSGSYWIVWAVEDDMPNWIKAAVIEYAGSLPEQGEFVRMQKNELTQHIFADDMYDLPKRFLEANVAYTVTPVVCGGKYNTYRLLQEKEGLGIIALMEDAYSVIDFSNLGKSDRKPEGIAENRPAGPAALSRGGEILYWKNEQSALAICTARISDGTIQKVISQVSVIDFGKEGK